MAVGRAHSERIKALTALVDDLIDDSALLYTAKSESGPAKRALRFTPDFEAWKGGASEIPYREVVFETRYETVWELDLGTHKARELRLAPLAADKFVWNDGLPWNRPLVEVRSGEAGKEPKCDIGLLDVTSDKLEIVTSARGASVVSVSPDHKQLALRRGSEVWLHDLGAGSGKEMHGLSLLDGRHGECLSLRNMYFTSGGSLFRVPVNGGVPSGVFPACRVAADYCISPDESMAAYSFEGNVYLVYLELPDRP